MFFLIEKDKECFFFFLKCKKDKEYCALIIDTKFFLKKISNSQHGMDVKQILSVKNKILLMFDLSTIKHPSKHYYSRNYAFRGRFDPKCEKTITFSTKLGFL